MTTKKYKRLSYQERVIIETLLNEGKCHSYIANKIGRARSTVNREVNKWVKSPWDKYKAELANWYAHDDYLNKRPYDKINTHKQLMFYVYRGLLKGWSPEIISGKIKIDYPNDPIMSISHEAIYTHIYEHRQARLNKKLISLLTRHKSIRGKPNSPKRGRISIKDQVSIDERPKHIEERKEVGHWEGDLVIGIKQASAIGTIVERKTRYTHIVKIDNKKSETVVKAFSKALNQHSTLLRKTFTYDNGTEMAKHKLLSQNTGMDVYFAHPYSSWERGTNENTNGLIRRFFPKGTDFNNVEGKELKKVQDWLNNRPRKVLGYYTPKEMLYYEINKTITNTNDNMGLKMGNKSPKDLFSFLMPTT